MLARRNANSVAHPVAQRVRRGRIGGRSESRGAYLVNAAMIVPNRRGLTERLSVRQVCRFCCSALGLHVPAHSHSRGPVGESWSWRGGSLAVMVPCLCYERDRRGLDRHRAGARGRHGFAETHPGNCGGRGHRPLSICCCRWKVAETTPAKNWSSARFIKRRRKARGMPQDAQSGHRLAAVLLGPSGGRVPAIECCLQTLSPPARHLPSGDQARGIIFFLGVFIFGCIHGGSGGGGVFTSRNVQVQHPPNDASTVCVAERKSIVIVTYREHRDQRQVPIHRRQCLRADLQAPAARQALASSLDRLDLL
jgi:hypothetical protein